ncbi:Retrovirus-related Pol polyprotein from transposon TNT 1-94 [Pseudolycoriella hygida]|uniref:Retrovirus-related Pol polyprotein from transposon TNT 1-94 n=1 Tax=Pseudolycoriella hygida TaxID=35572 RepID=A0A9Q0MNQ8_9DIPT|nr:Retrovirus-related Pol polyprotein from transposon TNT 1-94 [Pseudolycoriella hygida]
MAVTTNSSYLASVEKLDGRSNYTDWKFAVQAYLEHEGLWKCVLGTETDNQKLVKAKSKLILLIKPTNFTHIQTCETAKEIWDALSTAFNDSGLSRRVSLMRTLTSVKLEECDGMEVYVNLIMHTVHKLRGIGSNISEDWVGTFLSAGLPSIYQPMIMAIENSGIIITGDSIKTKLLQEPKPENRARLSSALATTGRFNNDRRGPRCFICNDYGHIAVQCRKQRKENAPSDSDRQGAKSNYATGFFAGFVKHGDINRTIDQNASGFSVDNYNRLQRQVIGRTTSNEDDYDPYRYFYVDDFLSFSSNSNSVEGDGELTNSNSEMTEIQDNEMKVNNEIFSSEGDSDFKGFQTGF